MSSKKSGNSSSVTPKMKKQEEEKITDFRFLPNDYFPYLKKKHGLLHFFNTRNLIVQA